jgi:hypothetical protein
MADEKNVQVKMDEEVEEKTNKNFDIPVPVKIAVGAVVGTAGAALVIWAIRSGHGKQISEVAEAAKEVVPEVTEEAVKAAI